MLPLQKVAEVVKELQNDVKEDKPLEVLFAEMLTKTVKTAEKGNRNDGLRIVLGDDML